MIIKVFSRTVPKSFDVGMEAVRILPEGLDGHDHTGDTVRKPHGISQENEQALIG